MHRSDSGAQRVALALTCSTAVLALGACSGGGGSGDEPPAESGLSSVAFVSASATSSELGGAVSVSVRLTTTEPALAQDVSVTVSDAATGTAISGSDYAAFSAQTVTFAVGATNGATQSVTLTPIDDATAEASETIVLALSAPTNGAQLGLVTSYTLTLTDDDSGGPANFVATEGASGTQNAVVHDSTLDVGPLPVGLGPNFGTRLRITNSGGQDMDLGAPRITGVNSADFVVLIESAPFSGLELAQMGAVDTASPLVAGAPDGGPGLPLEIDAQRLAALPPGGILLVHDFPAPGLGPVTLALRRRPLPIAADAVLAIDGVVQAQSPRDFVGDLAIYTGALLEIEHSRVFLALSSGSARGFIALPELEERFLHIVSDAPTPGGGPARARIVREPELAALGVAPPELCGGALEAPGVVADMQVAATPPATAQLSTPECRLAIETDFQLFQQFGDSNAVVDYVTQLIAAVSDQYFIDVQTTLSIAYLGVYTNAGDPWTAQDSGGTASQVLDQFRNTWVASGWPASANLAHFISGANLGGGIAYVNTLCSQSFGFGVSGNIDANINWNNWSGASGNFTWDFVVVAHELGHNFGSGHTHSYCPPLDQCYTNCNGATQCTQGTIMSYCHTCGGMSAITLEFHPVTANIMRNAVNSSCLGRSALAGGDFVQYFVRFNPQTTTGMRSATLEFLHDAANQPQPFRVQLIGEAE